MKTSARNQLAGKISKIEFGAINCSIELDLGENLKVVSVITNESAKALDFEVGENAYAIIKSSWIILMAEKPSKISARNVIPATITEIITGAVNSEVKLLASGNKLTAIVTNEAVADLGLSNGKEVFALFKASSVILGA